MSGDGITTCSALTSLFIQSMLLIGHLPSLQIKGTILVHLWWYISVVRSGPSVLRAQGSWIASTVASWISSSFIRLSSTTSCFLTLSWIIWNVLLMLRWVEFLAVLAKWFVGTSAWDALQDGLNTIDVVMAFFGTLPADLHFSTLVSFVASDFLAVVALLWVLSLFKCRVTRFWLFLVHIDFANKSSCFERDYTFFSTISSTFLVLLIWWS